MISMYNVGGFIEGCATQRRQVVILQHLAMLMDSDCNGVCGGDLIMGGKNKGDLTISMYNGGVA